MRDYSELRPVCDPLPLAARAGWHAPDPLLSTGCLDKYPSLMAYHTAFFALPEMVSFKQSPHYMEGPVNNNTAYVNNRPVAK